MTVSTFFSRRVSREGEGCWGEKEGEKKPSLERPKSWEEWSARFLEPRVESGPR